MKKIIFLLSVITLFSCEDPQPEDRLEGQWSYVSVDVNNTRPDIAATFTLKGKADTYDVKNLVVTVDGAAATDYSPTLEAVTRGDMIGKMTLTKGNDKIILYKAKIISIGPSWYVDSVVYMQGAAKFKYIGGAITR